jgi:MFS family permease
MKGVGGLNGWRWIFIIEGLLTIVVSAAAYGFIPNYPLTAKFLSSEERTHLISRLSKNQDATVSETFTWSGVVAALRDPKCWLYGLTFHTLSLPLYTLSLFLPTIIQELGFTAAQAQLLTIPPYAIATGLTVLTAVLSERLKRRAPFIMIPAAVGIVGYIVLLTVPSAKSPGAAYVGTILAAAGIYPACAIGLSWPANNVSGQTKRAAACAMQISIGNLGAVMGTQLYRTEYAPRFFVGHGVACGYLFANIIVVGILWLVLKKENKRKETILASRGETISDETERIREVEAWRGDEDLHWRFQT